MSRVARLVHIELMWQGALSPKQAEGVSLRKQPLANFMHTHRLRTLVVHIQESSKLRMRRRYEMLESRHYREDWARNTPPDEDLDIFRTEVRRTDLHPNYRRNRGMRTVQGMDFIHQLRGMKWIRFYDVDSGYRVAIRDSSFLQDINTWATRNKTGNMAVRCELENLKPLTGLENYHPSDEEKEIVDRFYDDTPVEDVPMGGSETSSGSSSSGSEASTDSEESESESESDSDSDSSSDGGDDVNINEIIDSDNTEAEDDVDHSSHSNSDSRDSGLFVPEGSCSAPTNSSKSNIIDLTHDNDNEQATGTHGQGGREGEIYDIVEIKDDSSEDGNDDWNNDRDGHDDDEDDDNEDDDNNNSKSNNSAAGSRKSPKRPLAEDDSAD